MNINKGKENIDAKQKTNSNLRHESYIPVHLMSHHELIKICLLVLLLAAGAETITCPTGQQLCGSAGCYDPAVQGCENGGTSIQCINSCNGICYSNSQFCYNNTKICNNNESVCVVKGYNYLRWSPRGANCYNSSQLNCINNTLCQDRYLCGTQCMTNYYTACVNNQTLCPGFYYYNRNVNLCGSKQQCYDNRTSVCVNRTTACPKSHSRLCGEECWNPEEANCVNGTIQCINSCNGTCYSNSQFCYNNTKICNNNESVCVVKGYNYLWRSPHGANCYNSSQLNCINNTLCQDRYLCGTQCMTNYYTACVNNQTLCPGFYYYNRNVNLCGSKQQCYDNRTSVCVNRTTACPKSHSRLCGEECWNPEEANCVNGTIQCINSCNGTCYSNSQFCYNNTKICNNNESVCVVKGYNYLWRSPRGANCYNSSQLNCINNTLCQDRYLCGTQCMTNYYTACVNNQTLCPGFYYYNRNVNLCGSKQQCHDNTTSVCLGNNGTVCPIGSQLCSGLCYNPRTQYCSGGNNTIYCLNNPSSPDCPVTSTRPSSSVSIMTSTVSTTTVATSSGTCCAARNCTRNSDCCQGSTQECSCYRHGQTDIYGFCINLNVKPICADTCPVQDRCKIDSDCCKCQCANVTFIDSDGNETTMKQCARR